LVGDPIDVVTGANIDRAGDFELPGPISLCWWRYYDSAQNRVPRSLGWGHSHEYDRLLRLDLDGLQYIDPGGEAVGFPSLEEGEEAAQNGLLLRRVRTYLYQIEERGQPIMEFEFPESGTSASLARLWQGDAAIEFRYSPAGHLWEIIDSRKRLIRVEVDPAGRVRGLYLTGPTPKDEPRALMVYQYDRAGNLIAGSDLNNQTLRFEYDSNNRMTRRTDRRNYSFHFRYDEQGRCVHSRGDDGLLEVRLEYDTEAKATFVQRGDGGKWTYFYNEAGKLTQILDPYGWATKFLLDEAGRTTGEVDPLGNVTQLLYDAWGKHDRRLDPLGHELPAYDIDPEPDDPLADDLLETPLEWEYGHLIDPAQIRRPAPRDPVLRSFPAAVFNTVLGRTAAYDPTAENGPPAAPESPTPPEAFNPLGCPLANVAPGHVERWKFDPNGNLVEHHDRDGAVYRYTYTSWNLLQKETNPEGRSISYEYSPQALVTRVSDAGGTVSEYAYDQKERLVEVRRHGRVREQYVYDAAENVIAKKNGQGRTLVTWEVGPGNLDKARRLVPSGEIHTFEHDEHGRIMAATTPDGKATFAYDEGGRLLQDRRDGLGVAHEFDLGQLVGSTHFDKFRVAYETDDAGDLVITDPTGTAHRLKRSPAGLVVRMLANGTQELCQYDRNGRCQRKAAVRNSDMTPRIRGYEYSAEGNLRAVWDTRQGCTRYRHDASHRLVEETLPDGSRRSFDRDPAGNLIGQPGLTGAEMESGNRLRAANGDRFTYNDRNHISGREGPAGTVLYVYNPLDLLVRCTVNGRPWTATYDGLCRRISKSWQGRTTTFYWDGSRPAAEIKPDGSLRLYLYVDETALVPFMFLEYSGLDAEPALGQRYYLFTNQIGVPVRVEDDSGQTVWSARIDPFGLAHVSPDSRVEMQLRFPGHYHDPETGLHYNRFRYYSPELGRYLQSDPLGLGGGINLYAYVDDPLTEVDIDGLKKDCPPKSGKGKDKKPKEKPPKKEKPEAKTKPKPPKKPKDPYRRPKGFRRGLRDKVWEKAKGRDGKVRDPVTGRVMKKSEPWEMGHKPGYEFAKHRESASQRGISRQEFLDEHNKPAHYRPELPSSNHSHKGESKTKTYWP
jgi:RHS repeat-associated protein